MPRFLLALVLSLCAAAPLVLAGCDDDEHADHDLAVQGDMAKPDLSSKD